MPKFTNFMDLEEFIRDKMREALATEVVQTVKEVEVQTIVSSVYNVYPNPKQYIRRSGNGGLMDIRNIHHYPLFNGYYYSIRNETMKNGRDEYLAPLIEYGHNQARALGDIGYEYPRYGLAYMRPRPFTRDTVDRLLATGEHIRAMKNGMAQRGIKMK